MICKVVGVMVCAVHSLLYTFKKVGCGLFNSLKRSLDLNETCSSFNINLFNRFMTLLLVCTYTVHVLASVEEKTVM